ncbi:MAG TPA: hypothetical protein VHW65_01720 [Gemmatimonadales bacterium]|jgi:hypothetical protein|nr:hypothetical protein [Gemmatimonadales bacterium]
MWPSVDPGPGPWTPDSVVKVGEHVVIARAKRAAVIIAIAGLVAAKAIAAGPGRLGLGSGIPIAVGVAVVSIGAAVGSLWVWNAIVVPRWWRWAIATGVNHDELVELAKRALLISDQDPWWKR